MSAPGIRFPAAFLAAAAAGPLFVLSYAAAELYLRIPQPVILRSSSSGRPRSLGTSKIHDSSLGSARRVTRPVTSTRASGACARIRDVKGTCPRIAP